MEMQMEDSERKRLTVENVDLKKTMSQGESERKELKEYAQVCAVLCGAEAAVITWNENQIWNFEEWGIANIQMGSILRLVRGKEADPLNEYIGKQTDMTIIKEVTLGNALKHEEIKLYILNNVVKNLNKRQEETIEILMKKIKQKISVQGQTDENRIQMRSPSAASFIPGVSHELRNFIFGFSAYLDAVNAHIPADAEGSIEPNKIAKRSLDRLRTFVEELMEYGNPVVESRKWHNISPIVREAVAHHHLIIERNKKKITINTIGNLPKVLVDEQSLRKAFIYLIGMFVQQEKVNDIAIEISTQEGNSNPGIYGYIEAKEFKTYGLDVLRLFEPFYIKVAGLGRLALPIARRILEYHGGTIKAHSENSNGLRIAFQLPIGLTREIQGFYNENDLKKKK
jgi:signal transduction histidine kinase